jgi:uncharacterized protein (DUF305 family)
MTKQISRRGFVKSSMLASAALPLGWQAHAAAAADAAGGTSRVLQPRDTLPMGKIGDQTFSRMMLGGNLMSGHAHARDLSYVARLMRQYNTAAKIRETLELAEHHGIATMNSWVMDNNQPVFDHWKAGGKMKWIAQVRLDGNGGFDQARRAIDEGAAAVHMTGDNAEGLLYRNQFEKVAEMLQFIKDRNCLAGVGAHDLQVVVECERQKFDPDFYAKTFHTHDYYTAPRSDETGALGKYDNSWCNDPEAVVECMASVRKPWIAFKILAAGALAPRTAFSHAFNSGADFVLVGMFDWQIEENAALAGRVLDVVNRPNSRRTRPWCA